MMITKLCITLGVVVVGAVLPPLALGLVPSSAAFAPPRSVSTASNQRQQPTDLYYSNDPIEPMPSFSFHRDIDESANIPPNNNKKKPRSKHDIAWYRRYQELQQFFNVHNHSNVPKQYPSNPQLSHWVLAQRQKYKKGTLSKTRQNALEALHFAWEARTQQWQQRYKELVEYQRLHGNCLVETTEYPELAIWVNNQKQAYRMGTLTNQTRVTALVSLGVFDKDKRQAAWSKRYQELLDFQKQEGHVDVPRSYPANPALGRWVDTQRTAYRLLKKRDNNKESSPLTRERIDMLEKIGFDWNPEETVWKRQFRQLQEYHAQHGHCDILVETKNGGTAEEAHQQQLLTWVQKQRLEYQKYNEGKTKSTMTSKRIEALNGIGFDWKTDTRHHDQKTKKKKNTPWRTRFRQLEQFKSKNGHVIVSQKTKLGQWVKAQHRMVMLMQQGKQSSMTEQRLAKLQSVGLFQNINATTVSHHGSSLLPNNNDKKHNMTTNNNNDAAKKIEYRQSSRGTIISRAGFVQVGMNDEELLAAWRQRYKAFR